MEKSFNFPKLWALVRFRRKAVDSSSRQALCHTISGHETEAGPQVSLSACSRPFSSLRSCVKVQTEGGKVLDLAGVPSAEPCFLVQMILFNQWSWLLLLLQARDSPQSCWPSLVVWRIRIARDSHDNSSSKQFNIDGLYSRITFTFWKVMSVSSR